MDLYAELKGWQTAIGSVLGFIAIILGALFNYYLNRKRDARIRREEMVAILSALYGEIITIRSRMAQIANYVAARYFRNGFYGDTFIDRYAVERLTLPNPVIYPAISGKIGTLDSQIALEIVLFYSRIEEAETWLHRIQEDNDRPVKYSVNYFLDPAIKAVTEIQDALISIERAAKIRDISSTPDIKKAIEAQEFENFQNE